MNGAAWVHSAFVLPFRMGDFEKLISELFGMIQKQTLLVIDPIEHLHFLSEQRLLAASSPAVCFHLCVPLLLPIDQMLSVGCLQIQAMTEMIIVMIKTVLLISISSLELGRAPGTVFKMMPCQECGIPLSSDT